MGQFSMGHENYSLCPKLLDTFNKVFVQNHMTYFQNDQMRAFFENLTTWMERNTIK
jgi:hypothetical protein